MDQYLFDKQLNQYIDAFNNVRGFDENFKSMGFSDTPLNRALFNLANHLQQAPPDIVSSILNMFREKQGTEFTALVIIEIERQQKQWLDAVREGDTRNNNFKFPATPQEQAEDVFQNLEKFTDTMGVTRKTLYLLFQDIPGIWHEEVDSIVCGLFCNKHSITTEEIDLFFKNSSIVEILEYSSLTKAIIYFECQKSMKMIWQNYYNTYI